jgi:hypothetical protein
VHVLDPWNALQALDATLTDGRAHVLVRGVLGHRPDNGVPNFAGLISDMSALASISCREERGVTDPHVSLPHKDPPAPPSKPDHTERNVLIVVTIIGLVLLILGLASMPIGPSVGPSSGLVSRLAGWLTAALA